MTAAQSGGSCPKYDKLIHCSGDRPSRYLQEALNCFEESRKLGSVKGTFNLGLCYEQGLGTCINLQKVLHSCVKQWTSSNFFHCFLGIWMLYRSSCSRPCQSSVQFKFASLSTKTAKQRSDQSFQINVQCGRSRIAASPIRTASHDSGSGYDTIAAPEFQLWFIHPQRKSFAYFSQNPQWAAPDVSSGNRRRRRGRKPL